MNRSIIAVAVASLLPYTSSFAQANSANETVVVTASRFEQNPDQVITPVNVVTRQEIEMIQAKSVTDVLRRMPGVEIAQNGGRGQNTSIFLRGTNGNQVLVLVDGIRYGSDITSMSINNFPVGLIERLEVIRGPGAAIYGSDAIGGVINIITRSEFRDESKSINVGAGSQNGKEASFVAKTQVSDKGHLQIAGGYDQYDGYDFKEIQDGTDYGYENRNIHLGYEHLFNANWSAILDYRWIDSLSEYNSSGAVKNGAVESQNVSARLDYQNEGYQSFVTLNAMQIDKKDYLQAGGESNADTFNETDAFNAQWSNAFQLTDVYSLGWGADYRKESLSDDATSWGRLLSLAGESRTNIGGYVSGRADYEQLTLQANARYDKHDEYDNYTTWSLSSQYRFTQNYSAYASVGTGFKAPGYSSLSTNPDLEPEKSQNFELGFSAITGPVDWNVSAYKNKLDNLIIWYSVPGSFSESYNVDADIKGLELEGAFNTGFIRHTLIAELKDHKDARGTQLARRAKENFKWLTESSIGDFDFALTYIYTGKRLDLPTDHPTSDDYLPATSLWDGAVSYWVADNIALRARVDNLLDEEYETAKGYRSPGRTFFASATIDF
ncbi:TonB-dependent receptor [Vibrio renipiscarius]|uniref:TonB-dependent receptor domain-containing protein n=1 Tax=Vibrio renipiscarius TaxID=1461322 RepID=UPI003553C0DA